MIGLVDYGMGNLRSVEKALEKSGATVARVTSQTDILHSQLSALVVPGQGAFRDCMRHLQDHGLDNALVDWIRADRPFLGICLGQQALFEISYEAGEHRGLGIFKGAVERFKTTDLKVPQIGWNRVAFARPDCPLFHGIPDGAHFYFDHSYFVRPADRSIVAGETSYGETFASVVWKGNCLAVQFHPEKSQVVGLRMLRNFIEFFAAKPAAAHLP